jgi:hypothetical protein
MTSRKQLIEKFTGGEGAVALVKRLAEIATGVPLMQTLPDGTEVAMHPKITDQLAASKFLLELHGGRAAQAEAEVIAAAANGSVDWNKVPPEKIKEAKRILGLI